MKHHNMQESEVFTFGHFEQAGFIKHCFSGKIGSAGTLNKIQAEARCFAASAGFDCSRFTTLRQVHGTAVVTANEADQNTEADGLVTNEAGVVLATFHADCAPLFFVDPVKRAVGLAHAGWRGTAGGIATAAVAKMANAYGCRPQDILAGIGPSIGLCCFEVDEPVAGEFLCKLPALRDCVVPPATQNGKYNINLSEINRRLLLEAGVLADHIETTHLCTTCHLDWFYSHRRQGRNRGSMAAFIAIK